MQSLIKHSLRFPLLQIITLKNCYFNFKVLYHEETERFERFVAIASVIAVLERMPVLIICIATGEKSTWLMGNSPPAVTVKGWHGVVIFSGAPNTGADYDSGK